MYNTQIQIMKKNAIIYNKYSANLNKRYLQGLCKQQ